MQNICTFINLTSATVCYLICEAPEVFGQAAAQVETRAGSRLSRRVWGQSQSGPIRSSLLPPF